MMAAATLAVGVAQFHRVPVPTSSEIVGEQSTSGGAMWALTPPLEWSADFPSAASLTIARTASQQPMLGFGAAFTDTSGWNVLRMNASTRAAFLEAGWGETGSGWTLGRVTINSADYSFKTYAYDNTPDDFTLAHFDHNLTYDKVNVQPFIKGALAVAAAYGADVKLFASPWSAPGWMKTSGNQDSCSGPNSMKADSPAGSYLQAWADYMNAWLKDYAASGLPMWGLTPQNEPGQVNGGGCCYYDPAHYTTFLGKYLGPTIRRDHPAVKILVWDYNKGGEFVPTMAAVAADAAALSYADGIATHWYDYGGTLGLDNVQAAQHLVPGVMTVATEACYLQSLTETWATGAELVALDTLSSLNFNTSGWTFWNAVLHTGTPANYNGGPQHGGSGGLSGPVFFNEDAAGGQSLRYQSSFFALGHVSRYARPGSHRVTASGPGFASTIADYEAVRASVVNGKAPPAGGLPLVASAFVDSAAGVVSVVVMNAGATGVTFKLADAPRGAANVTIPAHSIASYRWLL